MTSPTPILDTLVLKRGSHESRQDGVCVMEAVAWVAGEPHSDHPECVSPAIGAFLRSWNDQLDDEGRQMLRPLIPRVIGTRGTKKDEQERAWLATDWLIREFTPAWLTLAGIDDHAAKLRALDGLTSTELAEQALPIIEDARKASAAAWAAAGAAAGDAARAAAWDAARAAAGAAAGDAAWAAAGDAAWAAARAAAGDAAGDAAEDAAEDAARAAAEDAAEDAAARAAAGDAAGDAARAAAGDAAGDAARAAAEDAARAAARDAARAALAPTVTALQQSALDLVDRMIHVGQEETP